MRSPKPWFERGRKGVEPVGGYPPQVEGEDAAQDGVISEMDHHLVLILMEVLNWIVLTGVAIKGQDYELLEKFIFQYIPWKREN